jgi:hypothetical protein
MRHALTEGPAQADGDSVKIDEVMLWTLRPTAECTLDNPAYADFARRFATSQFAGSMECPAGGRTLEELVMASMERRAAPLATLELHCLTPL